MTTKVEKTPLQEFKEYLEAMRQTCHLGICLAVLFTGSDNSKAKRVHMRAAKPKNRLARPHFLELQDWCARIHEPNGEIKGDFLEAMVTIADKRSSMRSWRGGYFVSRLDEARRDADAFGLSLGESPIDESPLDYVSDPYENRVEIISGCDLLAISREPVQFASTLTPKGEKGGPELPLPCLIGCTVVGPPDDRHMCVSIHVKEADLDQPLTDRLLRRDQPFVTSPYYTDHDRVWASPELATNFFFFFPVERFTPHLDWQFTKIRTLRPMLAMRFVTPNFFEELGSALRERGVAVGKIGRLKNVRHSDAEERLFDRRTLWVLYDNGGEQALRVQQRQAR